MAVRSGSIRSIYCSVFEHAGRVNITDAQRDFLNGTLGLWDSGRLPVRMAFMQYTAKRLQTNSIMSEPDNDTS